MILYNFVKILSKYIYPTLLIIFPIIKRHIRLYNLIIYIKIKIISYILQIANIKKAISNIKTNATTKKKKRN